MFLDAGATGTCPMDHSHFEPVNIRFLQHKQQTDCHACSKAIKEFTTVTAGVQAILHAGGLVLRTENHLNCLLNLRRRTRRVRMLQIC